MISKSQEAVELYGIGRDTIYKAIRKRELKAYKPNCRDYLIKVYELEEWIQSKPV